MPDRLTAWLSALPFVGLLSSDAARAAHARRRDIDRLIVAALTAIITYFTTASPPPAEPGCVGQQQTQQQTQQKTAK